MVRASRTDGRSIQRGAESSEAVPRATRTHVPTVGIATVCAALAAVLLLLGDRYGPHRDELYFAAAGHRLAWGYPDQPALAPLMAHLADAAAPGSLVALRLPSLLATLALIVCAALYARLLGAGAAGQLLTATTTAASAYVVAVGHRLSTATFDTLAWTLILLIISYALVDRRPRLWLLAGLVAGIGLNNKHAVALLLGALVVAVALHRSSRGQLRTPYPWLGGAVAGLLWLPNLMWQARHDWPALALGVDIADEYGGLTGRLMILVQVVVIFSPLIGVFWLYGLVQLLRDETWAQLRPIAVTFLLVTGAFLITGGKGYYLAGAVVPLIAAGCAAWTRLRPPRQTAVAGTVLAVSGLVAWPAVLPLLPARTYAASFYPALDADQLETIGWPELVQAVQQATDALPAERRRRSVALTSNYGQAGALEWYGYSQPVFSGHNGFAAWGPPPDGAQPVVVVGHENPDALFADCQRVATVRNAAGAQNEEDGTAIHVCGAPRQTWTSLWPTLTRLDA